MSPEKRIVLSSALVLTLIAITLAIRYVPAVLMANRTVKFMSAFETIHETKPPLSIVQVVQLMGQPLRIEHAESTGIIGDAYHYPTYPPGGDFEVIFVNGVVFGTALPRYTPKT